MKRTVMVAGVVLIAAGSFAHNANLKPGRFMVMGSTFEQTVPTTFSDTYPSWNPGEAACPLHPENAVSLAVAAATNSLPGVKLSTGKGPELALISASGEWYYRVDILLLASQENGRGSRTPILVGLDGKVPPIREVPAKELLAEREQIRENLRQYQMEVIRAGMTPLPIPLTQEMDDQLVAEGVLPPKEADDAQRRTGPGFRKRSDSGPSPQPAPVKLTPEEQARLREEKRELLRKYQMEVIRAGMPPMPIPQSQDMADRLEEVPSSVSTNKPTRRFGGGSRRLSPEQQELRRKEVEQALQRHQMRLIREDKPLLPAGAGTLTKAQKAQLEKEGILFLADGSISNSVTGFCHPPRPGIVAE